jgi:hypothetical protein
MNPDVPATQSVFHRFAITPASQIKPYLPSLAKRWEKFATDFDIMCAGECKWLKY